MLSLAIDEWDSNRRCTCVGESEEKHTQDGRPLCIPRNTYTESVSFSHLEESDEELEVRFSEQS